MATNKAYAPVEEALDTIEGDVLPSLAALLQSVVTTNAPSQSYEARGAQLREVTRQIIDLTQFLAAVTAQSSKPQSPDESIPA